jgi:WD40 repeat protein
MWLEFGKPGTDGTLAEMIAPCRRLKTYGAPRGQLSSGGPVILLSHSVARHCTPPVASVRCRSPLMPVNSDSLAAHRNAISCVAFNHDCTTAISGSEDCTVAIWDTASGQCKHLLRGHKGPVCGVALTPEGDVAISTAHLNESQTLGIALVWDVASGKCMGDLPGKWSRTQNIGFAPGEIVFVPDGRIALVDGKGIRAWDVKARRYLHVDFFDSEGKGHNQVLAVGEYSAKPYLLIGGFEELRLCELKVSSEWNSSEYAPVQARAPFSYDVSVPVNVPDQLWAVGKIRSVAISDEGRTAASSSSDGIRIWSLPDMRCVKHIRVDDEGGPSQVALSSDGMLVVSESGFETRRRRVWDTSSGHCVRTSDARAIRNPGNSRRDDSLAMRFAPGGKRIFFGIRPNAVESWDIS